MLDLLTDLELFKIENEIIELSHSKIYLVSKKGTGELFSATVSKKECKSYEDQQSFFQSIELFSKVQSPSILKLIGFNLRDFSGEPFPTIITEFLSNGQLDNFLKNNKSVSSSKRYIILFGIAECLKILHSLGIIHKNLSPSSIFLDDKLYPRISDLNNLQMIQQSKPNIYIAPEIDCENQNFPFKSEIYSFSLIMYQLITDQNPFTSTQEFQQEVEKGEKPNLTVIEDEEIRSFLSKCWSDEPEERPSFEEICEEIRNEKFKKMMNVNETELTDYFEFLKINDQMKPEILELKQKADQGDVNSMTKYAKMLSNGEGIPVNKEEAAKYFKMSADQGDSEAMHSYGFALYKGEGVMLNKEEAAKYFKKSAEGGFLKGIYSYAQVLNSGEGVSINKEESARLYKITADRGDANSMNNYGNILNKGDGVPMNKEEASRYIKMAADKNVPYAMHNYALLLLNGDGVPVDKEKAALYFKMAADNGHVESMFMYSNILRERKNDAEGARYAKMAAEKGHVGAMNNYGLDLYLGRGVQINLEESARYFKMAAEKGNVNGMINYGGALYNGKGVSVNKEDAAHFFKLAAEKGDVNGILNYSEMLFNGDGIQINKIEAARYLKIAADKGHVKAMKSYALSLFEGEGVTVNKEEAAIYFKMAADLGDTEAMSNYSYMLANGIGVAVDKAEANRYYRMAVRNGYNPPVKKSCTIF